MSLLVRHGVAKSEQQKPPSGADYALCCFGGPSIAPFGSIIFTTTQHKQNRSGGRGHRLDWVGGAPGIRDTGVDAHPSTDSYSLWKESGLYVYAAICPAGPSTTPFSSIMSIRKD
ncbi:Hypothetical protein NTJ_01221 [Nesidiocoris tenuis]|uniref:Uncharacterized protein n=1 Tax=Nesidiocoris tenuis TaxID=355587 RepID=A0ABN7A8A9_9HEMI|nr:Hypothetical protein NTJ_01221 [Nesidiocoris tenuis]